MLHDLSACHPEAIRELQDDRHAAQRQDLLARVRTALEAVQHIVLGVHGTDGINLVDAVAGLEAAIADVESEEERGS